MNLVVGREEVRDSLNLRHSYFVHEITANPLFLRWRRALLLVDGELVLCADPGGRDGRLHRDPVRDGGLRRAGEDARREELRLWRRRGVGRRRLAALHQHGPVVVVGVHHRRYQLDYKKKQLVLQLVLQSNILNYFLGTYENRVSVVGN